jgi:hypothetical protein
VTVNRARKSQQGGSNGGHHVCTSRKALAGAIAMDKPATNADGSTDIYFGPTAPGDGKNWLRTLPDKGFFVALLIYGPTQAFFDQTWKPEDIERIN